MTCEKGLRLGAIYFPCGLPRFHDGLCVHSGDREQITGQNMIDGGRLHVHDFYTVSWLSIERSTKEVGKDSPEWRQALAAPRG